MRWDNDPEILQALSELRALIDTKLGWTASDTDLTTIRRITDAESGLIVYAFKWGNSDTTTISKNVLEQAHDITRNGDYLHVGPWLCRVVNEDFQNVTVERIPEI